MIIKIYFRNRNLVRSMNPLIVRLSVRLKRNLSLYALRMPNTTNSLSNFPSLYPHVSYPHAVLAHPFSVPSDVALSLCGPPTKFVCVFCACPRPLATHTR